MKITNTLAIVGFVAALSGNAFADGFDCQTADGSTNVKIYNHVQAENGTRNGAIMILSNTAVSGGSKTIARFTDINGRLGSRSSVYVADVDLRFNDSNQKGKLLLGTKLGFVNTITADLDFSYTTPVNAGEEVSGKLTIAKRDGNLIQANLVCTRYLKGE
jgi:hypothetical protein